MAKTQKSTSKTSRSGARTERKSKLKGWLSTDADEIERRRQRAAEEAFEFDPEPSREAFFGSFRVRSASGQAYIVEIRSLSQAINSCECPDHRVNRLGTCKHIEATLLRLQHRRKRAFKAAAQEGSPFIEIFLERRDGRVRVQWPQGAGGPRTRQLLVPFFGDDDWLRGDPLDALPALQRAIAGSHGALRRKVRVSTLLNGWLEGLDRRAQQVRGRQHFETAVAAGKASLDLLRHPLYPYQQSGMLHLAFTGRALLADEMGLGKTVQAVAACALLRQLVGIQRVLVVSPASLKGEWLEQIGKFTELSAHILQGPRHERLRQYAQPAFFTLANYEQIRPDVAEINATLAPDVIILDEAQRIKNWQTKTAMAIKRLDSPYAFVLTGTPVENRIDEIYSIVQFLDPAIFGPLFRFNRDFYRLDDKGRAAGYKNLDQLHRRLQPVLLRRRKHEVEGQLPPRTVNTFFVPMHEEQRLRYEEFETRAARLARAASERPLTRDEMERLQRYLACMRMLCDTPYILDQACRVSPKLDELTSILQEVLVDGEHKLIIFSEWQRMLELVREQLAAMGIGLAWHTGKVPQDKRREAIHRFRDDPDCRVFLSTDSGAVGLNLQVADVVINLDLPWNPAKLEQRIARAWRKHQRRPVQVINLVTEHSIEHRMLGLLAQKQALAEGIIDGEGDSDMALPSGQAAFMERVGSLFGESGAAATPAAAVPADPAEQLTEAVLAQLGPRIDLLQLHGSGEATTLLAVVDTVDDALREALSGQLAAHFTEAAPQLALIDRGAHAAIEQLIAAGLLQPSGEGNTLFAAADAEQPPPVVDDQLRRLREAQTQWCEAGKPRRMAVVLAGGGFLPEALAPLREAVEIGLRSMLVWRGHAIQGEPGLGLIDRALVQTELLPETVLALISRLRDPQAAPDEAQAGALAARGEALLAQVAAALGG